MSARITEPLAAAPHKAGSFLAQYLHRLQSAMPESWTLLRGQVVSMWQNYPQLSEKDLQQITHSVLVVVGENDDIELAHAQSMAAAIPDAELLVIPDVGHAVPRDAPQALLQALAEFLNAGAPLGE